MDKSPIIISPLVFTSYIFLKYIQKNYVNFFFTNKFINKHIELLSGFFVNISEGQTRRAIITRDESIPIDIDGN